MPKKFLVNAFIVFNMLVFLRVFIPFKVPIVDTYINFFSVYQDWVLFAPNPFHVNIVVEAELELIDGRIKPFHFSNESTQKYMKLLDEAIQEKENAFLLEDVSKFALRKFQAEEPDSLVSKVHLLRMTDDVPDMRKDFRPYGADPISYKKERFYTYKVAP